MDKKVWVWFLSSLLPYRKELVSLFAISLVLGSIGAVMPILMQRTVDAAVSGHFDVTLVVLIGISSLLTTMPIAYVFRKRLRDSYVYKLRGQVLKHLLRLDIAFHEDRGSTVVTTQAGKGLDASEQLINVLGNGLLIVQVPVAIFSVAYIAGHNLVVAGLLVIFMVVFAFFGKALGKRLSSVEEEYQDIDTKLSSRQREAVQFASIVKVSHAADSEVAKYWEEGKGALQLQHKQTWLYALFTMAGNGGGAFASFLIVIFFLPQLIDGSVTVGTFFALLTYATRAMMPASFLGEIYAEIKRVGVKIKLLVEMLEQQPQVIEPKNALTLHSLRRDITLSGVTFQYKEDSKPVLHDINLVIPSGKKTAIVGQTGSGKTTLARLVTRLYDPTTGVVEFDGTDVRHLSFASLYGQIAYLSQEVPILTGTIADNVSFGSIGYNESDVLSALEKASAHFVHEGEEGVRTRVGEMGKMLSGGERQRIALARIFMRKPSIIILDEATSALDSVTEANVSEMFDELSKENGGRTMIVIAHRLSTVQNADQIVVMDKGSIVDIGCHTELLSRCELYQRLTASPSFIK